MTTRHGHCAHNPTGKDQLYPDEIQEMTEQNFSKVKEKPCPIDLGFTKKYKGDQYDNLIAGWTKYWNNVFEPEVPLDPNIVKALIASESGFDPNRLANKKDKNSARGLIQNGFGFLIGIKQKKVVIPIFKVSVTKQVLVIK